MQVLLRLIRSNHAPRHQDWAALSIRIRFDRRSRSSRRSIDRRMSTALRGAGLLDPVHDMILARPAARPETELILFP